MKTIKLIGGLGNQMFQYALYRAMKCKGQKAIIDDYTYFKYEHCPSHAAYRLDIFSLKYNSLINNKFVLIILYLERFLKHLRLNITLVKKFEEKEVSTYDDSVFNTDKSYIVGYWQTEKYFQDFANEIRADFTYNGKWSKKNLEYRKMMQTSNSVCIHIRRGDYLNLSTIYGGICTEEYYLNAINYIRSKEKNPVFYVFTNDMEWSKQFFENESNVIFVEGNNDENSYMDMILMTYCRHHIIANSSFSWWGAWLANEGGITIAPKKWLNTKKTPDIWCKGWIKM